MIDYAVLRVIWWILMGILLIGFAITDGFDLGVAALLPYVARTDTERRITLNTIGPIWEGNQVWLILGAGVFFAAWPFLYAIAFSSFYFVMFLILVTLILRPVGFKYRSKIENATWKTCWDWTLCGSGLIVALLFGIAIGNVLQGIPFHFDIDLRSYYTGSFWMFFSPFSILCGLTSVAMVLMHGSVYLSIKTENKLHQRAIRSARLASVVMVLLFILGGIFILYSVRGYVITQPISHIAFSNPLHKNVARQVGAWMANFLQYPLLWVAPLMGIGGALGVFLCIRFLPKCAFILSAFSILGIIGTVGFSLFPFLLPSSSDPSSSLLVWDASASQLSLSIMLVCVIIFLPIILIYTSWVYRILRGKVTENYIDKNKDSVY